MSVAQIARGRPATLARRAATREPLVLAAALVLLAVGVMAAAGPLLAPYDPDQLYVGAVLEPVSAAHWMGTDDLGRDIFSRILVGARASVLSPVVVVVLSTTSGALVAIAVAWWSGWVDATASRVLEVIYAIPGLVLAVLAVAMFGKGTLAPVLALSVAYTPVIFRLVRSSAMTELGKPYFEAFRVQGLPAMRAVFHHLVPALLPMVFASATVGFGYAMLDLAAISFLGLGQQPPMSDWGVMVAEGQASLLQGAPEQAMSASATIVLTVLAVNVLGARVTAWAEGIDR